MIGNPVFRRELLGQNRAGNAWLVRSVVAVALCGLVLLRWPDDALADLSGAESRRVLQVFGYGLMAAIILLVPVGAATGIVRERRSGTLALLLNSPLTRVQLLAGKLGGSMVSVLIMLALALPAAAACYAMGGVDFLRELLPLYLVLGLLGIELILVGLFVSARMQTVDAAMRLTYLAVVVIVIGPLAPYRFVRPLAPEPFATALDWFRELSPIPAVMRLVGHVDAASAGITDEGGVMRYVIVTATVSVIFFVLGLISLNQTMLDKPKAAGKATEDQSASVRTYRRIMYLWFFDPQRRTALIGDLTNPVLVKELRSSKLGRSYWLMRLMLACLIISLALVLAATRLTISWEASTIGGLLVALQMAIVTLLSPVLASNTITGEREWRRWELLRLTQLGTVRIVVGKLLAVMVLLGMVLIAALPSYGVLMMIDPPSTQHVPSVLGTVALTALFAVTVSAACSAVFRQTVQATMAAFGLLLTLFGGTLLVWLGEGSPFSHATVERVLTVNPLASALSVLGTSGFQGYQLLDANQVFLAVGSLVAIIVLGVQTWRLSRPV